MCISYCSLGKFTVIRFCVRIVRGIIFSSLGVSDKSFITFKVKFFVLLLTDLMDNYT